MKKISLLLLTISVLALTSCEREARQDFDVSKAKWENLNATKYAFDYQVSCFCAGMEVVPARLIVENDVIIDVLNVNTGEQLQYPSDSTLVIDNIPAIYKTIAGIFDELESAIGDASDIEVTYEDTNGFPTEISIDWIRNAVDDEIYYGVSNFEKL